MNMLGKIRRMNSRDGLSISESRRRTGLARNTIKSWLKAGEGEEPKYRREESAMVLTPYQDRLKQWWNRVNGVAGDRGEVHRCRSGDQRFGTPIAAEDSARRARASSRNCFGPTPVCLRKKRPK